MQAEGRAQVGREGRAVGRAVLVAVAALVLVADQLTKLAIVRNLSEGESVALVEGWLQIVHVRNTGAAFGILRGFGGLLALLALAGVAVFAVIVLRRPTAFTGTAAALVLGGALGNLADRAFRGSVVDFIDVRYWPAFNVADSGVTIGAILLVWFGLGRSRADADRGA